MTWGVGVHERGSDGYYATVYCRCLIFHGCQYVSRSILSYIWRVSFQNEIFAIEPFVTCSTKIHCNTNESYVFVFFTKLIFYESVVLRDKRRMYLYFVQFTVFWNETLHVSSFFSWIVFYPTCVSLQICFGSVWQSKNTQPETADIQVRLPPYYVTLSLSTGCHSPCKCHFFVFFLLAVALASLWASKWAAHSSS